MHISVLEELLIWLVFYSVAGWVYESFICSVETRYFINRVFLNGPYCPIYGFGAVFDLTILGRIENPFLLFFLGAIVACTLEYLTSYVMEKIFHARWWDYSEWKFNINGRVCLLGAVVFGVFSVVLILWIHPFVSGCAGWLPSAVWHGIFAVLLALLTIDCTVTIGGFAGFDRKLKELSERFEPVKSGAAEKIRNSHAFVKVNNTYEFLEKKLSRQQKRMISAFPKLKSIKYNDVLTELRKIMFRQEDDGEK